MRYLVLLVLVFAQAGCAIVDGDHAASKSKPKFTPIEPVADSYRVEHGIVTVRQVQPRSDIVILPPSMQHVVWQRDAGSVAVVTEEAIQADPRPDPKPKRESKRPKDNWPLLEEDMNFDSEIGRVDMCDPIDVCEVGEYCVDLVPCERKDELSCFRVKQGDYCIEDEQ